MSGPTTLPSYDQSDSEAFKRALHAANLRESDFVNGSENGGEEGSEEEDDDDEEEAALLRRQPVEPVQVVDPRFERPTPSPYKRAALLFFIVFLFWLAFHIRPQGRKPEVVYAKRYSKEHKFRPAASPIITETMKDGRIKIRGAIPPTATPTPMATPTKVAKKRRSPKKKSKKKTKVKTKKFANSL